MVFYSRKANLIKIEVSIGGKPMIAKSMSSLEKFKNISN